MKDYTLEEFVKLCNDCTYEVSQDKHDEARKLGKDFIILSECRSKDEIEKAKVCKENKEFYKCLLAREDTQGSPITDEYTFLQDKNIVAKIKVFEPFTENGKLSQKWHVLISLLAFLDVSSFDENYNGNKNFKVKGRIVNITVERDGKTLKSFKINEQQYPSQLMKEWICEAVENNSAND